MHPLEAVMRMMIMRGGPPEVVARHDVVGHTRWVEDAPTLIVDGLPTSGFDFETVIEL